VGLNRKDVLAAGVGSEFKLQHAIVPGALER
jgi:hypothetical protein